MAGTRPADYPPPIDTQRELIKRELDSEDERIEVGVAIVGGGTAGLACANRLLALLDGDPETMERLGEVPVCVIEKAKACGAHSLSGAVMRPGPLLELFLELSREDWRTAGFAFGEVRKEAVYLLPNGRTRLRIPPSPPFRNHGNEVISVAALARYQQTRAEDAGAIVLAETAASKLIVTDGRVQGVRSGDKGRGKHGEELPGFAAGSDIKAQATVLAEGSWGSLTGAAIREFALGEDREPQVWAVSYTHLDVYKRQPYGADPLVGEDRVDGLLVTIDNVEHTGRQTGLDQQLGEPQRHRRVALGGLEDERVAARERRRSLPQRNHRWEVEWRDARHDA